MRLQIKIFLVLFICIFYSCRSESVEDNIIIIPSLNEKNQMVSDLVNDVSYKPLIGDPSLLPLEADRIDFSD
jgi:hypothetical protein